MTIVYDQKKHLTPEQVSLWQIYISTMGYQSELESLTDSVQDEIKSGFFRIYKGQEAFINQSLSYQILYNAFSTFTEACTACEILPNPLLTSDIEDTPIKSIEAAGEGIGGN